MRKKLLITGSNGQLGRAINTLYAGNDAYELINTDLLIVGAGNNALSAAAEAITGWISITWRR